MRRARAHRPSPHAHEGGTETRSSLTVYVRAESGGISPPGKRAPPGKASAAGMVSLRVPPARMPATPSSTPGHSAPWKGRALQRRKQ